MAGSFCGFFSDLQAVRLNADLPERLGQRRVDNGLSGGRRGLIDAHGAVLNQVAGDHLLQDLLGIVAAGHGVWAHQLRRGLYRLFLGVVDQRGLLALECNKWSHWDRRCHAHRSLLRGDRPCIVLINAQLYGTNRHLEAATGHDANVNLTAFLPDYRVEVQRLSYDPARRAQVARGDHHGGPVSEFVGCGRGLPRLLLRSASGEG